MVEYALILAHNTAGSFVQNVASWAAQLDWESVVYVALGLLTLRIAVGAFRPTH